MNAFPFLHSFHSSKSHSWRTVISAVNREGLPEVFQGSEIVDYLYSFFSYTLWLRST